MIDEKLPPIRQWADVKKLIDDGKLTPAEHKLIAAANAGEVAKIGTTVPTIKTDDVLIRAPLLRYLILGGCDDCRTQAAGVPVTGAWIADMLDLNFATAAGPIGFFDCHIAEQPQMMQLQLPLLGLNESDLAHGINAQGAQVGGRVSLDGITSKGEVRLSGGAITGQLDCTSATLENSDGCALNAQGVQVGGDVFLDGITAKGEVRLTGAAITGQLSFAGATLENTDGDALNLEGATVRAGFFGVTWKR